MPKWSVETDVPSVAKHGQASKEPYVEYDDGTQAMIYQVDDGEETGFFVRLQSWDDRELPVEQRHEFMRSLMGRRVRVTVETID